MREIVLSKAQIQEVCSRLGKEITECIKNEKKIPVIIGIMKGALPFMEDLVKYIDEKVYLDYLQISSYSGTHSTGTVQLLKDVSFDLTDRTAIIVEDIVDTGLSMKYLISHIKSKGPKDVKVCALFDKAIARKNDVKVDFVGVSLTENKFIIGYGLDYREIYRNEPEVTVLPPDEKEELDKMLETR